MIATGLVAQYNFFSGDARDSSGNSYNGTPTGNVTFGEDSFGKYLYCNGDRDSKAGTGTIAQVFLGNILNFTQDTDFSFMRSGKIVAYPGVSTSGGTATSCGLFGSNFDASMYITSGGYLIAGLRGSSVVMNTVVVGTPLGSVISCGLSYIASTKKFYVYYNGVLTNVGGTSGPTTFLTNDRAIGDNAIGSGDQKSAPIYTYKSAVRNRALTDLEMRTVTKMGAGWHSIVNDGSYNTNAIDTLGFNPSGLLSLYMFRGGTTDSSGNGNNGTIVGGVTPIADRFGNPTSAYTFDGSTGYINTPFPYTGSPVLSRWWNCRVKIDTSQASHLLIDNIYTTKRAYIQYTVTTHTRRVFTGGLSRDYVLSAPQYAIIEDGGRHMISVTATGDGTNTTVNRYLDGVLLQTRTQVASSDISGATTLRLGRDNSTAYLKGGLDEVIISTRIPSQADLTQLYKLQAGNMSHIKGKTYVNAVDTNTPPLSPIRMQQTKGKVSFTSINTI